MKKILSIMLLVVVVISICPVFGAESNIKGSLVIVGGALRADNNAVYEAFIERAGGKDNAKIGIVPAASGNPDKYAKLFTQDMVDRGLDASQVVVLPLAVKDDSKTPDVDEALWSENGQNPIIAEMVKDLTGIWFVGGDQLRITDVLLTSEGENTLVLDAIWQIYYEGAVIGGSSAGAAIMSDRMIAGGDSLSALKFGYTESFDDSTLDYQNVGGLVMSKGLGFFKYGIVDQHFDRKARLGRLAVVGFDEKALLPFAYGVEENTALVFDNTTGLISVAGTGGVVILDAGDAVKDNGYDDFLVSYIEGKDQYDVINNKAIMDPYKYTTLGFEYLNTEETIVGGSMSPNQRFRDFIAFELVDNEAKDAVSTYLFGDGNEGFEFEFSKGDSTEGYWGQSGAADLYSFENVVMKISPISIIIGNEPAVNHAKPPYVVKEGDVLWKIAKANDCSVDEIVKINKLADPNFIKSGQTLILPVVNQ